MDIYKELKKAGCEIDNHCSDLYVKKTDKSTAIVNRYTGTVSTFVSNTDKTIWYELPFQFTPWWEARTK